MNPLTPKDETKMETKHTQGEMRVDFGTGTGKGTLKIGEHVIADCRFLTKRPGVYDKTGFTQAAIDEMEANASRLATAWNSHDALLAYVECSDVWHSEKPWEPVFKRHGFNIDDPNADPDLWLVNLRRQALTQARAGGSDAN